MLRGWTTRLAISAFGLVALTAEGALAQPPDYIGPHGRVASESEGDVLFQEGLNRLGDSCPASSGQARVSGAFPGALSVQSTAGGKRPKVVATFPAEGAVVRPGIVVVRVTFDQPMACHASFGGGGDLPNPCPGRQRQAVISQDRRSFRTVCEVRADTRYRLPLHDFRNANGPAIAHDVTFSTSDGAAIASIKEALAEDTSAAALAGG